MPPTTWALLLLLGLIWGGSFFFGRIAVAEVPPFTLVLARVSLAALALHLVFGRSPGFYRSLAANWRTLLILGLLNNAIPFSLIFIGQTRLGAGLASILNATTPLWTVLISQALTSDEKISRTKLLGCAFGFAGTALLVGPAAVGLGAVPVWALAAALGAAMTYGFAGVFGRRFAALPPRVTATGQLTASSLLMTPVALLVDQPWQLAPPSATVIAAVLALALVSTAFAYLIFFRILASAGATATSLVTLLVPPSAILLGAVFLGEDLSLLDFAGMGLIALGLLSLDNRIAIRRTQPPAV